MTTSALHHPATTLARGPDDIVLSAEDADWTYCGLVVASVAAGGERVLNTGDTEVIVLPLGGSVVVEVDGQRFALDGRDDVFAAVTDWAYLPIDAEVRLSSTHGLPGGAPVGEGHDAVRACVRGRGRRVRGDQGSRSLDTAVEQLCLA